MGTETNYDQDVRRGGSQILKKRQKKIFQNTEFLILGLQRM